MHQRQPSPAFWAKKIHMEWRQNPFPQQRNHLQLLLYLCLGLFTFNYLHNSVLVLMYLFKVHIPGDSFYTSKLNIGNIINIIQWRMQGWSRGGRQSLRRGRQPIIDQFFPENCMKMKKCWPWGGLMLPRYVTVIGRFLDAWLGKEKWGQYCILVHILSATYVVREK